eukprot:6099169-Prymnesium_polylepis.1
MCLPRHGRCMPDDRESLSRYAAIGARQQLEAERVAACGRVELVERRRLAAVVAHHQRALLRHRGLPPVDDAKPPLLVGFGGILFAPEGSVDLDFDAL